MSEIVWNNASNALAPLYRKYHGQSKAQPAYVIVDGETKKISCFVGEYNSTPVRVWNGLSTRFRIPETLRADAIDELLLEIRPLIDRAIEGFTTKWDGSNMRGYWGDADDLFADIEQIVDTYRDDENRNVSPWDEDWFGSSAFRDLVNDGETIECAAERLAEEAENEGVLLDFDVEKYLRALADEEKQED